jgi:hypothetical protein
MRHARFACVRTEYAIRSAHHEGAATKGDPIRVVLADAHAVVRKGIREFLEETGDSGRPMVKPRFAIRDTSLTWLADIQTPRRTG